MLVLLLSHGVRAQNREPLIPVKIGSEFGFKDPDNPDHHVVVVIGGIELTQGPRRLLADTLVLVLSGGDDDALGLGPVIPSSQLVEAFLDGNVTIEEGDELVVGAQSVLLDGPSGKVTIVDGSWRTVLGRETVQIRFDLMRQLRDGPSEFEQLTYTTCDYAHAHWGVNTPWAVLIPTKEGRILKTSRNTAWVADIPLAIAPTIHFNIDRDRPPLRSVGFGTSRIFGTEIQTLWGADASGFLGGFAKSVLGIDAPVKGDWEVELDNYSSRGVFLQPTWKWSTESSHGRLLASGIKDRNDQDFLPTVGAAGKGGRIEDNTRGRVEFEHRTKIDEHRTIDVELSYLSDRGFLEEYYESESRIDKPPETYLSYRDVQENKSFTFLAKGRLNDFRDVVEYLPKLERRQVGEPVSWLAGGFLTSRDLASWARHRNEDPPEGVAPTPLPPPTHARSNDTVRIGTNRHVDWPIDLGPDRVVLTAGVDVTAFNNRFKDDASTPLVLETDDKPFLRYAMLAGVSWSQTWSGSRPATSETWNIDGLRQILEPSLSFNSVLGLNRLPHTEGAGHTMGGDIIPIDDVETLDSLERFVIGVRHRLQTHQKGKAVTILDTEVFMPLYPHKRRDNPNEPRTNGYVVVDSRWNPGANLWGLRNGMFLWRARLNPNNRFGVIKSSFSYRTRIGEGKAIQITDSSARRSAHFRTLGAEWVLTPKWSSALFVSRDLRNNQLSSESLILRQVAHKWIIDIELKIRRGNNATTKARQNDKRIKISFRPTVFGDSTRSLLDEIGRIRR